MDRRGRGSSDPRRYSRDDPRDDSAGRRGGRGGGNDPRSGGQPGGNRHDPRFEDQRQGLTGGSHGFVGQPQSGSNQSQNRSNLGWQGPSPGQGFAGSGSGHGGGGGGGGGQPHPSGSNFGSRDRSSDYYIRGSGGIGAQQGHERSSSGHRDHQPGQSFGGGGGNYDRRGESRGERRNTGHGHWQGSGHHEDQRRSSVDSRKRAHDDNDDDYEGRESSRSTHSSNHGFRSSSRGSSHRSSFGSSKRTDRRENRAMSVPEIKGVYEHPSIQPAQDEIVTNYIRVENVPKTLYVYSLSYSRLNRESGEWEPLHKRREIEGAYRAAINKGALKLDSMKDKWVMNLTTFKELWSTVKLHDPVDQGDERYHSEEFSFVQPNGVEANNVRITLRLVDTLMDIDEHLKSDDVKLLQKYIKALNANISEAIRTHNEAKRKDIIRPSSNKTFLKDDYMNLVTDVDASARARRGFFTSIRPGEKGILLNINTATSAFLPNSKVSDFISATEFGNNVERESIKKKLQAADKLLKGATLRIEYNRSVDSKPDVKYDSEEKRAVKFIQFGVIASQQKFYQLQPGEPKRADPASGMTVEQYFRKKGHNLPAGDLNCICVNVGKRVQTTEYDHYDVSPTEDLMQRQTEGGAQWIPACLLKIKDDQLVRSTLPASHVSSIIKYAQRLPKENAIRIQNEGLDLLGVTDSILENMGFKVDDSLITLRAEFLSPPELVYGNTQKSPVQASWDIRNTRFKTTSTINKLHMIAFPECFGRQDRNPDLTLNNMHQLLRASFKKHGITGVAAGTVRRFDNDAAFEAELNTWFNGPQATHLSRGDCTVVLLGSPKLDSSMVYSTIKRMADFSGRHTICAMGTKIAKGRDGNGNLQMASNLALKVNMKADGENHHIRQFDIMAASGKSKLANTIIMGADVAHPPAKSREGCPSVACVVSSVDDNFMRYRGEMRLQAGGQEKIEDMQGMVRAHLAAWRAKKGRLPTSILFYRDGVSESQFQMCEDHEIHAIKEAYQTLNGGFKNYVDLTFVVVGKRHHTRFYATRAKQTYETVMKDSGNEIRFLNGNVKPGLLVENTVTYKCPHNFFLQSHEAIQGTARSAHYHVLRDDLGLINGGELPELTHNLCYAFSRATKGVSYVAPAYIADRLCDRGMVYLRPWINSPSQGPQFKLLNDNEKLRDLSDTQIAQRKNNFAKQLANDANIWGTNYNEQTRLNPWHPSLDQGMFWI